MAGRRAFAFDRAADAAEAVLVVLAAPAQRRPEVQAELVAAIDAADDARDFDRAHAQVALDEHAGALGILVEAAQLAGARALSPCGCTSSTGHGAARATWSATLPSTALRQHRARVGAQDDQADVADERFLDDGRGGRAGAQDASAWMPAPRSRASTVSR